MWVIGLVSPLGCLCLSTAPNPYEEASEETMVSLPDSNSANIGLVLRCCLIRSKDFRCSSPHSHSFFIVKRSLIGLALSDNCGQNLLNWFVIPRKCLASVWLVGGGMSVIALTFRG